MAELELTEQKHCLPNDSEVATHLTSSAIKELDGMDKFERQRLEQRVVNRLKAAFDDMLGGNWNIILGKEVQITVGLGQFQRLLRFKYGDYRVFCFETYTDVKNMIEPEILPEKVASGGKSEIKTGKQSAEASPKAGAQLDTLKNPSSPKPKAGQPTQQPASVSQPSQSGANKTT